jgi:hypothetical protein
MTCQLRRYTVKPGAMDAFIADWREHALPVRARFGFEVVGAWRSDATSTFVWIVSHPGPERFEEVAEAYYASDDRARMAADPGRHLDAVETVEMEAVPVVGDPLRLRDI